MAVQGLHNASRVLPDSAEAVANSDAKDVGFCLTHVFLSIGVFVTERGGFANKISWRILGVFSAGLEAALSRRGPEASNDLSRSRGDRILPGRFEFDLLKP